MTLLCDPSLARFGEHVSPRVLAPASNEPANHGAFDLDSKTSEALAQFLPSPYVPHVLSSCGRPKSDII